MSVLVWIMTGIAVWHFAVFVPDRFWGGIVGAFAAALVGAVVFGTCFRAVTGGDIDHTSIATMAEAAVGGMIGLGVGWFVGLRRGEEPAVGE